MTFMIRCSGTLQALPSNKFKCSFKFPQFLLLNYSFKILVLLLYLYFLGDHNHLYVGLSLPVFYIESFLIHLLFLSAFPTLGSGEGNGTPLQYSCLENPMGGGAWQATVYGVPKSWTQLSDFTFMHWRRKWQPTPVFLSGESQGRGSLMGCRLWGRTESDMIEVTQQQQCPF